MMKVFYILPHCSTGGMPSYVLKQYQTFKDKLDIKVIETNYYGDQYVVQRNQFSVAEVLVSMKGDQTALVNYIKREKPDVVHFQEVPESFLRPEILKDLYDPKRKYNIVVTSHGSHTRRKDFRYIPDRIVAVSNWQKELFIKEFPDTEVDIWEYPIEDKIPTRQEKQKALIKITSVGVSGSSGCVLDNRSSDWKNILNIGLFTPGKNQGELFEIARKNPKNCYHFVGNQAENFRSHWEPLMKNKPDNCIVWGERDDVELFYQACDEMIFTSKLELNPICVKEALSYGLPIKMYRLETYGTDYDNNPLVTFIK